MASYSCLLLVASNAAAAAAAEAPRPRLPRLRRPDAGPRAAVSAPRVAGCVRSVVETEPCAQDVVRSVVSLSVRLSKACCAVLAEVGDKCVVEVLSSFPFGRAFLPLVKRVCGLVSHIF